MRRYIIFFFLPVIFCQYSYAQQSMRKLPYNINQPSLNISHPFISGDGQTLLYLTDYTEDGSLTMFWTQKNGTQWVDGKEVTRLVNRPDQNLQGAYSLNYDGTLMIITSRKSGLGGFELWYSEKRNGDWTPVRNFGAPINSSANEGAAVLTTDGKGMYFMRCSQMNEIFAEGCKLYFAEKKYGRWQEPQPLPQNINQYEPQMPRILADGETLIFSSGAGGGKGGFDLYVTKKAEAGWEDPVKLEFANTARDDQFVSAAAKGRYLYKAQPGARKMEIVQLLFPEDLKPKEVYRVNGQITDNAGKPIVADLKVFETSGRKRLINETTDQDGTFSFVLVEGNTYDVSLEPKNTQLQYFSKIYDLQEIPSRDRENLTITAAPYQLNVPVINEQIVFQPQNPEIKDRSVFEIRRLAALLRANPDWRIKVASILYDYKEDSICSDPDLTEVRTDTLLQPVNKIVPSELITTAVNDTIHLDSLEINGAYFANELDTLLVMIDVDSVHIQNKLDSTTISKYQQVVKTTYNNDRTLKEAEALKDLLTTYGVEPERIFTEGRVESEEFSDKPKAIEITLLPVF
jgi:hypothetical protein